MIECVPTARLLVLTRVVTLEGISIEGRSGSWPILVVPSRKLTVPIGADESGSAVTVAVKVTVSPKTLGLVKEVRVVVVKGRFGLQVPRSRDGRKVSGMTRFDDDGAPLAED